MKISRPLIFLSIFIFIAAGSLNAQNGTLRGVIIDSANGEALAYANVLIKETGAGASADSKGYFIISSIPGNKTYNVQFSYLGYITKELTAYIGSGKITDIKIELSVAEVRLPMIEKVGERVKQQNETDISLQRLTIQALERLPKGVETDVFRSLQFIPGVKSSGDVSARYYVRGGATNQNLTLLNGATVYNPFHALGMFSAIDPEMINSIEFYKGGFTSEFGGRLSSLMNIITKDGNKNNYSGNASISYISAKGLVEGPIPNGSFIITGRKSISTEVFKKFLDNEDLPINFHDFSFKLNYSDPNFIKGGKFIVHGFFSGDRINEDADYRWSNNIFGLKWFQVSDSPLFYELSFYTSRFDGSVTPNNSNVKPQENELTDVTLKTDFNYIFDSRDEVNLGFSITDIKTNLYLKNISGAVSDIGKGGSNISVYAKYKLLRLESLGLDAGIRYNLVGMSNKGGGITEPRVSLKYNLFPGVSLKGAWGIYTQELTTLANENEIISLFEPWVITPDYLEPAKATHYVAGAEFSFFDNLVLEAEAYKNTVINLSALNENKIFSTDPDLVSGSGESYGWEFMLRYFNNLFSFTGSYSLSWAYKEVDGWTYYPRYDYRNALSFNTEIIIYDGWTFNAIWIYNSGAPYTKIAGYYDKYYQDNFFQGSLAGSYVPYTLLGDKNLARLPSYHRLDLGLSKDFDLKFIKLSADISAINVYNRKNVFYYKRDTGEIKYQLPFLLTATLKIEI